MLRKLLGFLVATTLTLSSIAAIAQTAPLSITLKPGQSMHDAVRDSMLAQRVAKLRADWAASHPGAASEPPTVAPSITAGAILTPSVNVGSLVAAPEVSISFTTDAPGVNYVYYEFYSPKGGQHLDESYFYPGQILTKGMLKLQGSNYSLSANTPNFLTQYSESGNWTLDYALICDNSGICTNYTDPTLAQIFTTTTFLVVNNGTVDTTPPEVTSGKVLTPTVHLSAVNPSFIAQLGVRDDLAGVEAASVCVAPREQQQTSVCGVTYTPAPVFSGTTIANFNFGFYSGTTTGTWNITGYFVCDVAGNCVYDFNLADVKKLFGTKTFKVVQ